jgi:tripartite-type tricarboxylate transporter receptor subunit TctC
MDMLNTTDAKRRALMAGGLLTMLGALAFAPPALAQAAEWPKKQPIKLVVPWPPGGVADFLGRLIGESLGQQLGQQVIVDNKAGAGTNIGSDAVAKADPDGYTLLMGSSNNAVNMTLFKKMSYDIERDFAPVALVGHTPMVLVTHPAVPARDLGEFLRYARANPDKLLYASAGNGSPAHLAAEIFKRTAGVKMVHVPYKGAAPAVTDLIGGQVQVLITNVPASVGHIRSGKLKALAITGRARSSALPELPTFAEAGLPAYDASAWYGILAPKGTPAAITSALAAAVTKSLNDPNLARKLVEQGVVAAAPTSPEGFAKLIAEEVVAYRRLINDIGVTLD